VAEALRPVSPQEQGLLGSHPSTNFDFLSFNVISFCETSILEMLGIFFFAKFCDIAILLALLVLAAYFRSLSE